MNSAISAKLFSLGESKVQETDEKYPFIQNKNGLEIHLIGHLQKNKVRKAVELYDVIQTVDSIKLASRISKIAKELNKIQRVYLQVNSGEDPLKYGFKLKEALSAAIEISQFSNLEIQGIMMIPPFTQMDNKYRLIYTQTRRLRDEILYRSISTCKNLSMGMSRDFEMAIEEGATHIRLGTALFGARV